MTNQIIKSTAKATVLCVMLFIAGSLSSFAQTDTWVQKSDFGYDRANVNAPIARQGAAGFSIGSKGYIGTGSDKNDFWEYDTIENTWTQKADFGGTVRWGAVGFSIGSKGYIGTGLYSEYFGGTTHYYYYKDFWEYDPVANTWVQKADFEGNARYDAIGFSIGSKGYLGTGYYYNGTIRSFYKDFWEYDPVANAWKQRADFGGTVRSGAVGFSIGSKGYLGTGYYYNGSIQSFYKDFWEYNPISNAWTQKADFGGDARWGAVGFSIGSKGYLGTGHNGSIQSFYKDFWEYDPIFNNWAQKADFGGTARGFEVSFTIGGKAYLGTGVGSIGFIQDFWEYDANSNIWIPKANFGEITRTWAVGFSINNKGYLGTGYNNSDYYKDFWEYDPVANAWTQKADFGGDARAQAVGFSIGNKGYIGTGSSLDKVSNGGSYNDFWEYDPDTNMWMHKANFKGKARYGAVGFSVGNKGYIGTGVGGAPANFYKDFWEYDPISNAWTQKADFGGDARSGAVGFSIGNKGYLGTGNYNNDFWEYDPSINMWIKKMDFEGTANFEAVGFSITNKGYIGTGSFNGTKQKDFWEYDPANNTWTRKADFGGGIRFRGVGFSIGNKGYLGTGSDGSSYTKDFWEYTPDITCALATNLSVTNITSTSALLKWDAVAGAEAYRLRYKPLHSGNWVSKASSGIYEKVTGLLPGTAYRWEVKTYCHKDPPQVTSDGSAKGEFTTATLGVSNEDVQQFVFQIYPIPAKDILYIQTNVSASFSLVNQVGKILLTKNINGTGSINVAGIAAGLYYLKNNSTGAVEKVVIRR